MSQPGGEQTDRLMTEHKAALVPGCDGSRTSTALSSSWTAGGEVKPRIYAYPRRNCELMPITVERDLATTSASAG